MKTLAIETSCDDTSCAIVSYENGYFNVEKNILYSQIKEHTKFWWVIPELASRLHEEKIIDILKEIWKDQIKKVDFISYTCCPWLPWSLLVGKTLAHTLSLFLQKEEVWINHIHWHIFSIFAERHIDDIQFPLIFLTVSWWHNDMYVVLHKDEENKILDEYVENFSKKYNKELIDFLWNYKIINIWFTLDDAAWEAFDKVSRLLWWPYPWWKWIWEKAKKGKKQDFDFPRIFLKKDEFNFSFSWLKAQCNYKISEFKKQWKLDEQMICNIAYEFQEAVVETLWKKLLKASKYFWIENIALVGWVSSNDRLKEYIRENMKKYNIKNFYTPVKNIYSTDNAAMIGVVWLIKKLNTKRKGERGN